MLSLPFSTSLPLRATARHCLGAHYAVAPDRLAARLPPALSPDAHEGRAYVSLVGLQLVRMRVGGMPVPGGRRVPVVALQVPVREAGGEARGTLTVQAYVSRRLVAWAARTLYDAPVAVTSMQPVWTERPGEVKGTYRFDRAGREQRLRVGAEAPPVAPAPDTPAAFLRGRPWRYSVGPDGTVRRARIERPDGPLYRVREQHVTVRWGAVFGTDWAFLTDRAPHLVLCAPGGPVTLHGPEPVGDAAPGPGEAGEGATAES